jgi:hypothetical protein
VRERREKEKEGGWARGRDGRGWTEGGTRGRGWDEGGMRGVREGKGGGGRGRRGRREDHTHCLDLALEGQLVPKKTHGF